MFRSIASLAIVILFQTAFAVDVSKLKNQEVQYIDKGVMPISALRDLKLVYANGFIGDLEIGKLTENDTVVHVVEASLKNWTNSLQTVNLHTTAFPKKKINYVAVLNAKDSYGAVCGEANDLGSNESPRVWVRVGPQSIVTLTMLICGH